MSPFFTSPEVAAFYLYVEAENFPTSQSWRVLQSWYTGGGPEQGFRCYFADGLNRKSGSVWGAG